MQKASYTVDSTPTRRMVCSTPNLQSIPHNTPEAAMIRAAFRKAYKPTNENTPMIKDTKTWFEKAVPNPTAKNLQVQLGVHLEEISEMFEAMKVTADGDMYCGQSWDILEQDLKVMAAKLKRGTCTITSLKVDEVLDAIADQRVTGIGVGHMLGMNTTLATEKVDASNWSKFDAEGNPLFDANGKITKGPNYKKPDLTDCLPSLERVASVIG